MPVSLSYLIQSAVLLSRYLPVPSVRHNLLSKFASCSAIRVLWIAIAAVGSVLPSGSLTRVLPWVVGSVRNREIRCSAKVGELEWLLSGRLDGESGVPFSFLLEIGELQELVRFVG